MERFMFTPAEGGGWWVLSKDLEQLWQQFEDEMS